jgi:hypothetical protein
LARLSTVAINDPRVTGYSACRARNLIAIHAHVPAEDTRFYQLEAEPSMFSVWQYMPVDAGEVVTELWKRHDRVSGYTSLMVRLHGYFPLEYHCRLTMNAFDGASLPRAKTVSPSWVYGQGREPRTGL